MTVLALVCLGIAVFAPALSLRPTLPVWVGAAVTATALGGAAMAASATAPVQGVALAATLVLTTLAAVTGGVGDSTNCTG